MAVLMTAPGAIARAQDGAAATAPAPAAEQQSAGRSMAELETLVAPIALYPDVVLAQALPASTVPLQLVEAARFAEKNPGKTQPPAGKTWEMPVVNLLGFPEALKKMNEDLSWLQDLGDAVIDQQADVMEAIQNVRKRVNDAGALPTNDKQTVIVEKEVVKIVPADPEVVYVPTYNPSVVYVDDDDDEILAGFIGFGVGMAVGACIWDDCDWHGGGIWHGHGDVDIDVDEINIDRGDRNTNIDRGDRNTNVNRERNVDRSQTSQWKPSSTAKTERQARQQAEQRVRNPGSGVKPSNVSRNQAQAQDRTRSASNNTRNSPSNTARNSPSSANRQPSGRDSAFGGSSSGSTARQQSNRGNSSRGSSASRSSGGSRGGGAPRGGGSRGGGGRGGRR